MPSLSYSLSFKDAFESTIKNRAEHRRAQLNVASKEAAKSEAVAGVLPTVRLISTTLTRERVEGSSLSAFTEENQRNTYFNATQPLFQGGAEYNALPIASAEIEVAEQEVKNSRLQLMVELAIKYYGVLLLKKELDFLNEQKSILSERIKELSDRARIGRTKRSEVTRSRSEMARVDASAAQKANEYKVALNDLEWFVGQDINTELVDLDLSTVRIKEQWKEQSRQTPDLIALEKSLENADRRTSVEKAGYLPTVELEGNYYLERAGALEGSDWDISLTASWEFFSGGETRARAAQARIEKQILELELKDAKNLREIEFESRTQELISALETVEKLKKAIELSEASHKDIVKEYRQGLVTNLEVLRSLDDLLNIRLMFEREKYSAKQRWFSLRALSGDGL